MPSAPGSQSAKASPSAIVTTTRIRANRNGVRVSRRAYRVLAYNLPNVDASRPNDDPASTPQTQVA
jgi:hypothetical protein